MCYPVVIRPDEHLKMRAQPVTVITDEIVQLLGDMYETVLARDGIGLTAPRIGEDLRMVMIEIDGESGRLGLINPVIIEKEGTSIDVEDCLGVPETCGAVERTGEVTVRYFDREGEEMEVTAYGYLARAFQYEIDHSNDELFIDKMIGKITPEDLEAYMEEHFDD